MVLCRCAAALSIRKEPLCVAAIEAAEALGYFPPSLDQVRAHSFVVTSYREYVSESGMKCIYIRIF